jgi:hypothetical protein
MKTLNKTLRIIVFGFVLSLFTSCDAGWVATIPGADVFVDTNAPYEGAIWIGPEYYWSGGRYLSRPGHWEHGRGKATWHGGSWTPKRNGYHWNKGYWK